MSEMQNELKLRRRRMLIIIVAAVVFLTAVLVFAFRKQLADVFGVESAKNEAWVFESGYSQSFAPVGNGLAIVSSAGIELLGPDGYTVVREVFSLDSPAVAACDTSAAAWDAGGRIIRVADMSGNIIKLDTDSDIVSVKMNSGGMISAVTDEPGYKGSATIWDKNGEPIYKWYSGESYPITSSVSPDGKLAAVLCVDDSGGVLRLFSLDSEKERGSYASESELFRDMNWISGNCLCAISDRRVVFTDDYGTETGSYDFGGMYLTGYSLDGDGFAVLALSRYISGVAEIIVTVDKNGNVIGSMEPPEALLELDARGNNILCLYTDKLAEYTRGMSRQGSMKDADGIKSAVIRKNGDAIALGTAYAQIFSF